MSQRYSQTLVDLFESGASLNADGIAVIYDDEKEKRIMTYAQLVTAVHRVYKICYRTVQYSYSPTIDYI